MSSNNGGTLVTIGNGTQSFSRLLKAISVIKDNLPQPVYVQTGNTDHKVKGCNNFSFMDETKFRSLLDTCSIIITHGGAGTILTAIDHGKKPIVIPRRSKFNEVINDHQLYLTKELTEMNLIHSIIEEDKISDNLEKLITAESNFTLSKDDVKTNMPSFFLEVIDRTIQDILTAHDIDSPKFCLVSACGGHLYELKKLFPIYSKYSYFHAINDEIKLPGDMKENTYALTLCERDFRGVINFFEAAKILFKERPNIILTTGSWIAIPFSIIGKLFGIKIIYIETMTSVNKPTLTGRIMYFLTDHFFYQWKQLKSFFPKGNYCGFVL